MTIFHTYTQIKLKNMEKLELEIHKEYEFVMNIKKELVMSSSTFHLGNRSSFSQYRYSTYEECFSAFCLDEANSSWIVQVFKDSSVLEPIMYEHLYVKVPNNDKIHAYVDILSSVKQTATNVTTSFIVIESGQTLLDKIKNDKSFLSAKDEMELLEKNLAKKEREDQILREEEKNRTFFKQWQWLEKKRSNGDFDKFLLEDSEPFFDVTPENITVDKLGVILSGNSEQNTISPKFKAPTVNDISNLFPLSKEFKEKMK